ncbi:MAG: CHAT domain-containing protein, partial [Gammaproteobacteria bacterium]
YAAEGRPVQALDAFRTGFSVIEQHGGGLSLDEVWPFFQTALAESKRDPSQRQALFAEMFRVGQTVKGSITAETTALTAARLAASDQNVGVLIRQLQDARRQRDDLLEMLTAAEADSNVLAPQLTALEQQWQAQGNTIAGLERQVQAAAPRYNQLIDQPVSLDDVKSVLHPGEALVQVLVGTDHSMGFFVDADGIEAYQINLTEAEAKRLVAKLRAPFEAVDTLPEFPVQDAYALYQRLFEPVAKRLESAKHVITVPNGPFLSLPFGLFVVAPPPRITDYDYTQVAWMASRQAITLAPSVQSIVNLRKTVQPSLAGQTFIGFGDFKPYGNAEALLADSGLPDSCKDDVYQIANASSLPKTAVELRTVAASLEAPQSSLHLGDNFSEADVEETKLSSYKVVYFATHGLLPSELSCYAQPALLVSKSAKANKTGDGLLTASDILGLSLDADLVVLSACNTGGPGGQTGGESLSGLARAFFYAGARSLLVTHWETPDEPTTVLMVDTFKRLGSGTESLAEALRESQAELIHRYPYWSHPKAWASFSVVGDGAQRLTPIKLTGTDSTGSVSFPSR